VNGGISPSADRLIAIAKSSGQQQKVRDVIFLGPFG